MPHDLFNGYHVHPSHNAPAGCGMRSVYQQTLECPPFGAPAKRYDIDVVALVSFKNFVNCPKRHGRHYILVQLPYLRCLEGFRFNFISTFYVAVLLSSRNNAGLGKVAFDD